MPPRRAVAASVVIPGVRLSLASGNADLCFRSDSTASVGVKNSVKPLPLAINFARESACPRLASKRIGRLWSARMAFSSAPGYRRGCAGKKKQKADRRKELLEVHRPSPHQSRNGPVARHSLFGRAKAAIVHRFVVGSAILRQRVARPRNMRGHKPERWNGAPVISTYGRDLRHGI